MRFISSLVLFLFLLFSSLHAKWDQVLSTQSTFGMDVPLKCGWFFDADHGMVGGGSGSSFPLIFYTDDGGGTWAMANSPLTFNGFITSVFFSDALTGYATLITGSAADGTLWKSIDGGKNWFDITQGRKSLENITVYKTSKALIVTSWDGAYGGISLDDGATWIDKFIRADAAPGVIQNNKSNGIDFTDDLNGVVSMGPNWPAVSGNACFITNDGGLTWRRGWDFDEAWSVYAVKNTNIYFLAPEGNGQSNRDIFWSTDGGNTWALRYQFPNKFAFTGHIAGKGQTLYVQESDKSNGTSIYRSDDLGATWKNVGGLRNDYDSRFVVTGCRGEVVYAFNDKGVVMKTSDGGDGTLSTSNVGNILEFFPDTLRLFREYCPSDPARGFITLTNPRCDNNITIDSMYVVADPNSEFDVDTSLSLFIDTARSIRVPITFRADTEVVHTVNIRIKGRSGVRIIDTTFTVIGKQRITPQPYILPIAGVIAGMQITVPIYIYPTQDTFAFSAYTLHLKYNTDLLEPKAIDEVGTLSVPISSSTLDKTPDGLRLTVRSSRTITNSDDLTKSLITIDFNTYLTSSLSTNILLDSFSTETRGIVPLCDQVQSLYTIEYECGDSMLSNYLGGKLPTLDRIIPNPTRGAIDVRFSLPADDVVSFELFSLNGVVARSVPAALYTDGEHTMHFDLRDLENGTYIMRLKNATGYTVSQMLVVRR